MTGFPDRYRLDRPQREEQGPGTGDQSLDLDDDTALSRSIRISTCSSMSFSTSSPGNALGTLQAAPFLSVGASSSYISSAACVDQLITKSKGDCISGTFTREGLALEARMDVQSARRDYIRRQGKQRAHADR